MYQEIFLSKLQQNQNIVYHDRLPDNQAYVSENRQEWSQIFQLGNHAQLVCIVQGNQLDMRLVHLTEEPMIELLNDIQNGRVPAPSQIGIQMQASSQQSSLFMRREIDLKQTLQTTFKQYEKAKIIMSDDIVPNLSLAQGDEIDIADRNTFGLENAASKFSYQLTICTVNKLIYRINFDKHYLRKNETIQVEKLDTEAANIMDQVPGQVRVFDTYYDHEHNREVYIFGSYLFNVRNDRREIHETTVSTYDNVNQVQTLYRHEGTVAGIFHHVKNSLRGSHAAQVASKLMTKTEKNLNLADYSENGDGVICMKRLTNSLLCIIYSTGFMRVTCLQTNRLITEIDLRGNAPQFEKLLEAKLTSLTHLSRPNSSNTGIEKVIDISLAFSYHESLESQKSVWKLFDMQLKFHNINIPRGYENNEELESRVNLGNKVEIINQSSQILAENQIVTSLELEMDPQGMANLWLATQDSITKQTCIMDCNGKIWDRTQQAIQNEALDHVDMPRNLQDSQIESFQQHLKAHYINRIFTKNRFTTEAIENILADLGVFDRNLDLKQNVERLPVSQIKSFISNLTRLEQLNSKVLAISNSKSGLRLVVRPLGISSLKTSTRASQMALQTDLVVNELLQQDSSRSGLNFVKVQQLCMNQRNESLISFMSALKYQLIHIIAMLDEKIIRNSQRLDNWFGQILSQTQRVELVHKELILFMHHHTDELQTQIRALVQNLIVDFLENISQDKTHENNQMIMDALQDNNLSFDWSPFTSQLIENGLQSEVSNLYEVLRNMKLVSTFCSRYQTTFDGGIQYRSSQELLDYWLRQIASLNFLINQKITHKNIKSKKTTYLMYDKSEQEQNLLNYLINSKFDTTGNIRPNFNNFSSIKGKWSEKYMTNTDFSDIGENLQLLIKNFAFSSTIVNETYMPSIVKELIRLGEYRIARVYSEVVCQTNLGMHFTLAFLNAVDTKTGSPAAYQQHINQCLMRVLAIQTDRRYNEQIDWKQMIIDPHQQFDIMNKIQSNASTLPLQFVQLCLAQFRPLDEKYSIQLTLQALKLQQVISRSEKDILYEQLFMSCNKPQYLKFMYLSCENISDLNKRKNMLGLFFERVYHQNIQSCIAKDCFFSQEDSILVVEYLQERIYAQLQLFKDQGSDQSEMAIDSLQWKKELELLCCVYHFVAQLYNYSDNINRFMWQVKLTIDSLIQQKQQMKTIQNEEVTNKQIKHFLEAQVMILRVTHAHYSRAGEEFKSTDQQHVKQPENENVKKKRSLQEISSSSARASDSFNTYQNQSGNKLLNGYLDQVSANELLASYLIALAKLKCIHITQDDDLPMLIRILSEEKRYNLAIELALATNQNPAYPLTFLIYQLNQEDCELHEFAQEQQQLLDSVYLWHNQQQQKEKSALDKHQREYIINFCVNKYLPKMKINHMVETAQGLIAIQIDLPAALQTTLLEKGQIRHLLSFYLNYENLNLDKAVEIVVDNAPRSIQVLAETDLQLVMLLLQELEKCIQICQDQNTENKALLEAAQRKNRRFQGASNVIGSASNSAVNESLRQALSSMHPNNGSTDVYSAIFNQAEQVTDSEEVRFIKKQIGQCDKMIQTYQHGLKFIEDHTVAFLNV